MKQVIILYNRRFLERCFLQCRVSFEATTFDGSLIDGIALPNENLIFHGHI
jgi:hypothetical protein